MGMDLTSQLLQLTKDGDERALEDLFPMVIDELRKIAHAHMRKESAGHTLQTTALINEAYVKLVKQKDFEWNDRTHFFAVASKVMRHILLDYARTRSRSKRGGGAVHVEFDEAIEVSDEKSAELIALDDALNRLAAIDELKARIVEMRHFGGMSVEETAKALDIAPITVMRHWNLAKAWLRREVAG
jgi:RNA polymerase sigma factor (TIGR02999 family)